MTGSLACSAAQQGAERSVPLRVAYCIDSFEVGGTELNAVRTAEALDRSEVELVVFHLHHDGPLRARYEATGYPLVHVPAGKLYSPSAIRQGWCWRSRLRRQGFDLVHTHDVYTNAYFGFWGFLASHRCGAIASRRWSGDVPRASLGKANSWSYRAADRVLANSPRVARLLVAEGVPPGKVAHVPNFLDEWAFHEWSESARAEWRARHGIPAQAFLVGIVARLSAVKNHALLFSAFRRLPDDCWLAVVGDGPQRDQLVAEARALGIGSRVCFLGTALGQANLHAPFDVSVLCSRDEGFPNSIIEAMAAARPVVATDVGGVSDVLQDGVTGLLIRAGDDAGLSEALQRLRMDGSLRRDLGSRGRRLVAERHSVRGAINALTALYREVVLLRSAPAPHSVASSISAGNRAVGPGRE